MIPTPLARCEITASLSTNAHGEPHDRYAEITIWTGKSRLRCLAAFLVARHARPHASLRMIWRGIQ